MEYILDFENIYPGTVFYKDVSGNVKSFWEGPTGSSGFAPSADDIVITIEEAKLLSSQYLAEDRARAAVSRGNMERYVNEQRQVRIQKIKELNDRLGPEMAKLLLEIVGE